jgi:hypothetical protein
MEVVIKKKNEIVRLENEIIIFEKLSMEWSMDDHTKDSKKIPPYTSSHYSSLELFIKMFKFLKTEKLSSKNKMVGRKNGEYF